MFKSDCLNRKWHFWICLDRVDFFSGVWISCRDRVDCFPCFKLNKFSGSGSFFVWISSRDCVNFLNWVCFENRGFFYKFVFCILWIEPVFDVAIGAGLILWVGSVVFCLDKSAVLCLVKSARREFDLHTCRYQWNNHLRLLTNILHNVEGSLFLIEQKLHKINI